MAWTPERLGITQGGYFYPLLRWLRIITGFLYTVIPDSTRTKEIYYGPCQADLGNPAMSQSLRLALRSRVLGRLNGRSISEACGARVPQGSGRE